MTSLLLPISLSLPCAATASLPVGLALETPAHYAFGCAAAPDGSVWFVEFNHQQLRRYGPGTGRVEVRLSGLPGMYGLAVGAGGEVFIGQDLGDAGHPGRVLRIDPASGRQETVIEGLTRPRQLALGPAGDLYVVCEAGSVHAGASPSLLRVRAGEARVEVALAGLRTPQGVAVAPAGTVYVSEYGVQGQEPGRILALPPSGESRVLTTGLWQARGLACAPDGSLYALTEANREDQGNSGSLVRIDPGTGEQTVLLDGLDYPQFPCVAPDGRVYFVLNRDSWLASFANVPPGEATPWPDVPDVLVAMSGGRFAPGEPGEFRLSAGSVRLAGSLIPDPGGRWVQGWARIPAERLSLNPAELYTNRGDPEHPQPGLFELPWVSATASRGSTFVAALAVRGHVGTRYPQTDPGTAREAPAPGFGESPVAYDVYFEWTPRP